MNVSLISRFFDVRNEGVGNYSKILSNSLKCYKDIDLTLLSQDDSFFPGNNILDYIFFSLVEIPFKLKYQDVYHALSPIESIRLKKSQSVVTIHDLMPIKIPDRIYENKGKASFVKLFFKKAMNNAIKCEKIVATSIETANDLNKFYSIDLDKIDIVRQGISGNFYPKYENKDKYKIGTISNLNNRKRIDVLIKAFLKADIKNSELLIGGKGPQFNQLKKLANNDPRISFLGFVPDEMMNDFYNSLDLFVFPSYMEGYGLPIVEAMACAKPVVTLDDAYIPYDIKNKTHISTKLDLVNVLEDKNFHCDIKSNLKFAKEHSPEIMAKQMIEVYKGLI